MDDPKPTPLKNVVLATVEPGLDQAAQQKVGSGSVAVAVQAGEDPGKTSVDIKVDLAAQMRISSAVVAYGDAWAQPLDGKFGADVGARVLNNLDIYAGGWADTSGGWGTAAGVKLKF